MQFKPIENCHMKNTIIEKDFKLGMTSFLFHAFTLHVLLFQNKLHGSIILIQALKFY
jgi:hypothetical protein